MFNICQSKYNKIYSVLSKALQSQKKDKLQKSTMYLLQYLNEILDTYQSKPLILSDLVCDEKFLFPSKGNKTDKSGLYVEYKTDGLLSQIFSSLGVPDNLSLSTELNNAIEDLHSVLSTKHGDTKSEVSVLRQTIDKILKYL